MEDDDDDEHEQLECIGGEGTVGIGRVGFAFKLGEGKLPRCAFR